MLRVNHGALVGRWVRGSSLVLVIACGGSDATSVSMLGLGAEGAPGATENAASTHPIAFISNRYTGERSDIARMSLDGEVLAITRGVDAYHPRWSGDGDSIAFREQIENTYAEVGLVAPDGTERVALTSGEQAIFGEFPVNWAPGGRAVAFASRHEAETTRIWLVPREGGAGEPWVANDNTDRRELAWSPDGARVAYADYHHGAARHSDGITKDLWVADALDPSRAVNVTAGRVYAPINVRWAPDSRRVAFQAFALDADGAIEGIGSHEQDGPYMPPDYETFFVDLDTAELTRVTNDAAEESGLAWSPDGSELLISSQRDGDFDLWLFAVSDPGQSRNLIDDDDYPYDDRWPDWFAGSR